MDARFILTEGDRLRALHAPLKSTVDGVTHTALASGPYAWIILTAPYAYETGARLYVGHNMRHMPVVQTMRQLIQDGAIGDVKAIWCRHFVGHGGDFYFKDWHADRSRTTGLLLQKGAHDIDVIHWLAGASTREVTAMGEL